jgi:hypothetical protein
LVLGCSGTFDHNIAFANDGKESWQGDVMPLTLVNQLPDSKVRRNVPFGKRDP